MDHFTSKIFHENCMGFHVKYSINFQVAPWSISHGIAWSFHVKYAMNFCGTPWIISHRIPWGFYGKFHMSNTPWNSMRYQTGTVILHDRRNPSPNVTLTSLAQITSQTTKNCQCHIFSLLLTVLSFTCHLVQKLLFTNLPDQFSNWTTQVVSNQQQQTYKKTEKTKTLAHRNEM